MWCQFKEMGNSNTNICDVCDEEQTIAHLLFECEYLSGFWARVREALDYDIVCDSVICGTFDGNFQSKDTVITLVSFLIYKDWLLHSLESKKRPTLFNMELFKSELQLRIKIYEKCNMVVHVNQIINLLSLLHLDLSRYPLLHKSLQPPLRTVRVMIQPESSGCHCCSYLDCVCHFYNILVILKKKLLTDSLCDCM